MTTSAYLFLFVRPLNGQVSHMSIMGDRHPTSPLGLKSPVEALLFEAEGEDYEAAVAKVHQFIEAMPKVKALWDKYGSSR